jgi:hypothetical protein
MNTILVTNVKNHFGEQIVKLLSPKHNLIVVTPYNKYSVLDSNVEYYNNSLMQDKHCNNNSLIKQIVRLSDEIVNHGNINYNGIDICIDCSAEDHKLKMNALILHQEIAHNCVKKNIDCKILYNYNTVLPEYFNTNFAGKKIKAYNCDADIQTALDIIDNKYKFSTGTHTPFFDTYEGKYSPLLYL